MTEKATGLKSLPGNVWLYFLAVFFWSWGLAAILIFSETGAASSAGTVIFIMAACGPGLAASVFTALEKNRKLNSDFWKNVFSLKNTRLIWYFIIILMPVFITVYSGFLSSLMLGGGLKWNEHLNIYHESGITRIFILFGKIAILFIGEIGWRGFAQKKLQENYSALLSSLIVSVFWALWYLPAFFIADTYYAAMGTGSADFWSFFVRIIGTSFIISWIYNNTGRKVLPLIFFHITSVLAAEFMTLSVMGNVIFTFSCVVTVAVIILLCNYKTMLPKKREALHKAVKKSLN